jgi:hypothetical protein
LDADQWTSGFPYSTLDRPAAPRNRWITRKQRYRGFRRQLSIRVKTRTGFIK